MPEDSDFEDSVIEYLDQALDEFGSPDALRDVLIRSDREIKMNLLVQMDGDIVKTYPAFRVQHSNLLGPYKGGLRFNENSDVGDFRSLALLMTLKLALFQLPLGGAKGGVKVNPRDLAPDEKRAILKEYVNQLECLLGDNGDIPASDSGTNAEDMAFIQKLLNQRDTGGQATGKPVSAGGIEFRQTATGYGVSYVTKILAPHFLGSDKKYRVAIQGFGNVGEATARYLDQSQQFIIVAVSDKSGALHDRAGLDISSIIEEVDGRKTLNHVAENLGIEFISNDELIGLDVDILIPAATEGTINKDNQHTVSAKLIVEAANGPLTIEADRVLTEKGIVIVPDIFANAGGVLGSYFEWESRSERCDTKTMKNRLQVYMNNVLDGLQDLCQKKQCSLRVGCYGLSLGHLEEKLEDQGFQLKLHS